MYIGIDIHKRHSQIALMDEEGNLKNELRLENEELEEFAKKKNTKIVKQQSRPRVTTDTYTTS